MSGQLKVGYQTTAFENHSYYQVALFTLVSPQEQITCLQIQNFIIIYYWYLLSRSLIWKKIYRRVKYVIISWRLRVHIDDCKNFLLRDDWRWWKICSRSLVSHFFLDNKWSYKLVRVGWYKVCHVVQNQTLNIWRGKTCV